MAINKVAYGDQTLLDLTEDTVTADKVLEGETFHDKSGVLRSGNLVIPVQDVKVNGESVVNSEKVAEIDIPTTDIQTAVDEFETYNGGLLSECKVALSPNQDLHGYSEPWVGGAGKNLINKDGVDTNNGYKHKYYINQNGTESPAMGSWDILEYAKVEPSTTYTISGITPAPGNGFAEYDENKQLVNAFALTSAPFTFTTTANTHYIRTNRQYSTDDSIQFEKGSTATAYEPYSNICPISGHTQVEVGDVGKNKIDAPDLSGVASNYIIGSAYVPFSVNLPAGTYTLSFMTTGTPSANAKFAIINSTSSDTTIATGNHVSGANSLIFTASSTITALKVYANTSNAVDVSNIQIEKGSTATAYEPYNGYQVTVNLGGTYYSGTLDVVSGEFTVDSAFIASYNGETLPSTWISDRDVYAVGTTPTTGAEVCYKLATPQSIQLSPTMVKALVGENHLSAPLDGQEITESKYRELFTWDEVEEIAQKIADSKIDNIYTSYNTTFSSAFTEARYVKKIYEAPALTALQIVLSGATSITFNHQLIFSDSQTCCELIQFGSGARIGITDVAISQGSVTFTFDSPLTKAIGFRCRITNDFVS